MQNTTILLNCSYFITKTCHRQLNASRLEKRFAFEYYDKPTFLGRIWFVTSPLVCSEVFAAAAGASFSV